MGRNAQKRKGSKGNTPKSRGQERRAAKKAAASPTPIASGPWTVGLVLLLVAVVGSFMLALQSLEVFQLPGCGPESACSKAANSVWGRVPGLGWPTSFVGLAFFIGLAVAWFTGKGRVQPGLVPLVTAGAVVSVLLTVVMLTQGYVCLYCVLVHVANVAFAVLLLRAGRGRPAMPRQLAILAGGFALATAGLAVAKVVSSSMVDRQDRDAMEESIEKIAQGGGNESNGTSIEPSVPDEPFTGRYRLGPEVAPIRIVIISDYQCPDCRRVESELRTLLDRYDQISFSAKHFPMCSACNRFAAARNFNPHPNACWAARAAETAGILGGTDGFYRMHHWLFDRAGTFEDPDLKAALPGLGFDTATFISTMQSVQTKQPVLEDIEEGIDLGLMFTPMIFINGEQLYGWRREGTLTEAVERLVALDLEPKDASGDQPVRAAAKYVNDWREERTRMIPLPRQSWARTPAPAPGRQPVEIVVFGDYQESGSRQVDAQIRAALDRYPGASYAFRHYPFDKGCNPHVPDTRNPYACMAAKAAEAAGAVNGAEGFWAMHEWLFAKAGRLSPTAPTEGARALGLDASAFATALASAETQARIAEDVSAGRSQALRTVPSVFVNGKLVPRWSLEGVDVIGRIIEEAAGGSSDE